MFCQILYKPKIFLAERGRPRYEFSATVLRRICKQWFPNKIEGMTRGGDEGKSFIFFSFLYLLSPYSARLCVPYDQDSL